MSVPNAEILVSKYLLFWKVLGLLEWKVDSKDEAEKGHEGSGHSFVPQSYEKVWRMDNLEQNKNLNK